MSIDSKASDFQMKKLNFPLESGLNTEQNLRDYFSGREIKTWEADTVLENYSSNLYMELNQQRKKK